jgi:hypothetical protein
MLFLFLWCARILFQISQFCQFILRPNALGSLARVFVTHSVPVDVFFVSEGKGLNENRFLGPRANELIGSCLS